MLAQRLFHFIDADAVRGQNAGIKLCVDRPLLCAEHVHLRHPGKLRNPLRHEVFRVLVDRLWPRGVKREDLRIDAWMRELGPSTALRRWYGHDVQRWHEFVRRYETELTDPARKELMAQVERAARRGPLTLLCAARDAEHSNAAVIAMVLKERLTA